jgi:predicted CoA-binding protein
MNPALLRPRSIAILGAADLQKLNARTLKALLDKGYEGEIYPVNPKYLLKDVAFRRAPVTRAEAGRMLNELRSRALLDGVRSCGWVARVE